MIQPIAASALLLILVVLVPRPVKAQRTVYVDGDASGANDGSSWPNAFVFLQDALAVAAAGDQVWVAEGVYHPDQGATVDQGDLYASFEVRPGILLIGGFQGSESVAGQSDWLSYRTILSGDLLRDDAGPVVRESETRVDNSRRVVTLTGSSGSLLGGMRGFEIVSGHANVGGGGMLANLEGDGWELSQLAFRDNFAPRGGGLYLVGDCTALLRDISVVGNVASDRGGGAFILAGCDGSRLLILNSHWKSNTSGTTGGALEVDGPIDLVRAIFEGNSSFQGGGIRALASSRLLNVQFFGNRASWGGGAYSVESVVPGSPNSVVNSVFSGNTAPKGAAIISQAVQVGETLEITNSTFSAPAGGGSIFHTGQYATLKIRNSILWGLGSGETQITVENAPPGTVRTSILEGSIPSGMTDDGGNLHTDPQFVDAPGPDGVAGTWDDDVRLAPGSPGINSGANESLPQEWFDLDSDGTLGTLPVDLVENPRIISTAVDMGAYEAEAGSSSTLGSPDPSGATSQPLLRIYPQPFGPSLHIQIDLERLDCTRGLVEIFDSMGRRIVARQVEGPTPGFTLDTSAWSPGLFLVRVSNGNQSRFWATAIHF